MILHGTHFGELVRFLSLKGWSTHPLGTRDVEFRKDDHRIELVREAIYHPGYGPVPYDTRFSLTSSTSDDITIIQAAIFFGGIQGEP